jgi:hypothetical protein
MTKPRDWPNKAAQLRDESTMLAEDGLALLAPLVEGRALPEIEVLRRVTKAYGCFLKISRNMLAASQVSGAEEKK